MQTKEQRLEYNREWCRINPEKRRESNLRYRLKNRNDINQRQNKTRLERIKSPDYREKMNKYSRELARTYLQRWLGFIPSKTTCQCCSRVLFFAQGNKKDAIHFDHRNGKAEHIISPTGWLKRNERSPESEQLWISFGFGILCRDCNLVLPTKGRVEFLEKALSYAKSGY